MCAAHISFFTESMQEAAALPLVGITAWQALFEKMKLQKDIKILIHGGVGAVISLYSLLNGAGQMFV